LDINVNSRSLGVWRAKTSLPVVLKGPKISNNSESDHGTPWFGYYFKKDLRTKYPSQISILDNPKIVKKAKKRRFYEGQVRILDACVFFYFNFNLT